MTHPYVSKAQGLHWIFCNAMEFDLRLGNTVAAVFAEKQSDMSF